MKKTIVRYLPPNPIIGARELNANDFKEQGIFTQKKPLSWKKENGFWLDADDAKISPEALVWLESQKGEFAVETQEIEDEDAEDTPAPTEDAPVEGEQPTGAGTPGTTTGTTTSSSGRR